LTRRCRGGRGAPGPGGGGGAACGTGGGGAPHRVSPPPPPRRRSKREPEALPARAPVTGGSTVTRPQGRGAEPPCAAPARHGFYRTRPAPCSMATELARPQAVWDQEAYNRAQFDEMCRAEAAVMKNPANVSARAGLAAALYNLGYLDEALEEAGAAVTQKPDYAYARLIHGVTLYGKGRGGAALESLERAIGLDPADIHAHHAMGVVLQSMERHGEALEAMDRGLRLDPGSVKLILGRGLSLEMLGRNKEALEAADRAIALEPGHRYAHKSRGRVCWPSRSLPPSSVSFIEMFLCPCWMCSCAM